MKDKNIINLSIYFLFLSRLINGVIIFLEVYYYHVEKLN